MNFFIHGNKNNKKNNIKIRSSDKKDSTPFVMGGVLYVGGCYFICQYAGWQAAYPHKSFNYLLNMTLKQITTNPFSFFLPNTKALLWVFYYTMIFGLVVMYLYTKRKSDEHANSKTVSGSALWIKDKDLSKKWDVKYSDPPNVSNHNGNKNMILTQNIYMSMNTRQTRRNNNVLVIGGSGAGKSRFFVKPNLCEMPLNTSFCCTDPSGELLADTGMMLEDAGFKIKVFNLVNMAKSDRYNPMNYIHSEVDVILLVDCILANTTDPKKSGGDDFWEKAQKLMLQAFIFLIWKHGEKLHLPRNLSSVLFLMDNSNVSEDDSSGPNLTDEYFMAVKSDGWWFDKLGIFHRGEPTEKDKDNVAEIHNAKGVDIVGNDICQKQYTKFKMGAGKTLKSIIISAAARLSTLDSNDVANLLSDDDLELDKIGDEKTALFIIIPQEHESFNFLAAMLYTQLFQVLYYHAENECRGNYLVTDSNGENVKIFAVPQIEESDNENTDEFEEEIVFSMNMHDLHEQQKSKQKRIKSLLNNNNQLKFPKINEMIAEGKLDASADEKVKHYDKDNKDENMDEIAENMAFTKEISREELPIETDNEIENSIAEQIKKEALAFCKRAKEKVHCVKKGNYYYIKVPGINENDPEDIVGIYRHEDFAKKKYEAIKAGCKISVCGLRLPYHVRFILDEFANIGQIPDFTKKLATMRKYEISASVILQNLAQIKNMYKDDWGSIMGNCDSFLFLGCPEYDTLEYVSKMLGKGTIIARDRSQSRGGKKSNSLSYKNQGRELATPDELRRLKDDECIFILRGEQPYKGKKHQYVCHNNYKYTADASENNVYHFKRKNIETTTLQNEIETSHLNITESINKTADNNALKAAGLTDTDIEQYRNTAMLESAGEIYKERPTIKDVKIGVQLNKIKEMNVIPDEIADVLFEDAGDIIEKEYKENITLPASSDKTENLKNDNKEDTDENNDKQNTNESNRNSFERFSTTSSDEY